MPETDHQPPTILLADDNPDVRAVVEMMLELFGFRVTAVEDGLKAFQACQKQTFDLMVIDCQMPVMDGLSAVSHIRTWQTETGAVRTPIAMLSAYLSTDDQQAACKVGVDQFISKPVTPETLGAGLWRTFKAAAGLTLTVTPAPPPCPA